MSYTDPVIARLTAIRRLAIVNIYAEDPARALREALKIYSASEEEVRLWRQSHAALGVDGLTSGGLTRFVRQLRHERRERTKANVARRTVAINSSQSETVS